MVEAFRVDLHERWLSVLVDQLIHCGDGHALTTFPSWRSFSFKPAPACVQARQCVAFPKAMEHRLPWLVADGLRQNCCGGETLRKLGCEFRLRLNGYDPRPSVNHRRSVRAAVCADVERKLLKVEFGGVKAIRADLPKIGMAL